MKLSNLLQMSGISNKLWKPFVKSFVKWTVSFADDFLSFYLQQENINYGVIIFVTASLSRIIARLMATLGVMNRVCFGELLDGLLWTVAGLDT